MQVVLDRIEHDDLAGVRRRVCWARFQSSVRKAVAELGGQRVCWRIARVVHNAVLAARHEHLTTRGRNRLTGDQARTAVAGSLLRQLHAVITSRQPWNAEIAGRRRVGKEEAPAP